MTSNFRRLVRNMRKASEMENAARTTRKVKAANRRLLADKYPRRIRGLHPQAIEDLKTVANWAAGRIEQE